MRWQHFASCHPRLVVSCLSIKNGLSWLHHHLYIFRFLIFLLVIETIFKSKKKLLFDMYRKFFNWNIIALQCPVGVCCAASWINCMCIYTPALVSLPPTALWLFKYKIFSHSRTSVNPGNATMRWVCLSYKFTHKAANRFSKVSSAHVALNDNDIQFWLQI